MLKTYDELVGKHDLPVGDVAEYIATEYLKQYRGNAPAKKIFTDFLIVAVASLKRIPIVCTEDNKTMASEEAKATYKSVNSANNLEVVVFISLDRFKELL